jgi:hypothetical protein
VRAPVTLAMLVVLALVAAGCGGSDSSGSAVVRSTDSSWIQGQSPLTGYPGYLSIALRANSLGDRLFAARKRELALIEARRIAAQKRAKADRLRKYLEAKRRAEARYRAALRRAARERKRQLAKLEALRRKRAAELRRLRKKLHVPPGQECKDPRLRRHFHCQGGQLPIKKR